MTLRRPLALGGVEAPRLDDIKPQVSAAYVTPPSMSGDVLTAALFTTSDVPAAWSAPGSGMAMSSAPRESYYMAIDGGNVMIAAGGQLVTTHELPFDFREVRVDTDGVPFSEEVSSTRISAGMQGGLSTGLAFAMPRLEITWAVKPYSRVVKYWISVKS